MRVPPVTVLLSVHNGQDFLDECLANLLSQTLADFELLVIDDGSDDATPGLLRRVDDPRLRVHTNERNRGLTASLAWGVENARGEWIARADVDDLSAPTRLDKQFELASRTPQAGFVTCHTGYIDALGRPVPGLSTPPADPAELLASLSRANVVIHGSVMFSRHAALKVGNYRPAFRRAQDYDLWLRLAERFQSRVVPEPLYFLRLHDESITARHWYEQTRTAEIMRELHVQRMQRSVDDYQRDPVAFEARFRLMMNDPAQRRQYVLAAAREMQAYHVQVLQYVRTLLRSRPADAPDGHAALRDFPPVREDQPIDQLEHTIFHLRMSLQRLETLKSRLLQQAA